MKSYCIKTANKKIIEYLLNKISKLNFSDIYYCNKSFKIYDNSITVILPLSDKDIKLAEDEKGLLERLPTSSVLSRSQIEELTNYSKPKTIRILNSLSQKGLIQKTGSGPNVKYLKKHYK